MGLRKVGNLKLAGREKELKLQKYQPEVNWESKVVVKVSVPSFFSSALYLSSVLDACAHNPFLQVVWRIHV